MANGAFLREGAALILLIAGAPVAAQVGAFDPATEAAQQRALDAFARFDGTWRGEAVTQAPGGALHLTQTERVGPMLGGTVRLIEGKAYRADGTPAFNALAVIAWDAATNSYSFRSYAQGHAATLTIRATMDGYVWEVPAGRVTIRYRAMVAGNRWDEIGERVMPGTPPQRFFEMHLTRVGDTNWPAAGTLPPK